MKRYGGLILTGVLFVSVWIAGCGSGKKAGREVSKYPRDRTLYVGGWEWSAPSTFNRLAGNPNWPVDGIVELMYETLFGYNQLTGKLEPILGKNYARKDSAVTVELDEKAMWNDGTPVTPEDVVYTFELDKKYPTPRHGNWNYLDSVYADKDGRLIFRLNKENYNPLYVLDMLCEVSIVPKPVYKELEKKCWVDSLGKADYMRMLEFKNDSMPVASGPYVLYDYSDQKIVLKRCDNYWGTYKYGGKLPVPVYIIHSLYKDNSHFSAAMIKGKLDLSQNFMPRLKEKKDKGIRAWMDHPPFHQPGSIPTMFMCLKREPFDDVNFRRALVHAVDFGKISRLAMSGYSPEMRPGLILPFGPEKQYYSKEDAEKHGYKFDIDEAKNILKAAGYSWNGKDKLEGPDGSKVRTLSMECPRGWSDWENTIQIVKSSFAKIGLDVKESFVDYGVWERNIKKGSFDFSMRTMTAEMWPSTPYKRFEQLMSSRNLRPVGETVNENYGRYSSPETDRLLGQIPGERDRAKLKSLYRKLNIVFMNDIPQLPLMYRPTAFYQFSVKNWKGFPTEENPTAPPQCCMISAGIKGLWFLKPAE